MPSPTNAVTLLQTYGGATVPLGPNTWTLSKVKLAHGFPAVHTKQPAGWVTLVATMLRNTISWAVSLWEGGSWAVCTRACLCLCHVQVSACTCVSAGAGKGVAGTHMAQIWCDGGIHDVGSEHGVNSEGAYCSARY
jgi:hypothetical protein